MSLHPRMTMPLGVFVILLSSYAFFWHARDWNISSRLMLTYALADRGTVLINGLEDHTRDRARIGSRFYSDKSPGLSLFAVPPYLLARTAFGLPHHPLNRRGEGFTHWPADYWITLATSGLATALTGSLLVLLAFQLGCGPRRSALVGLSYGLATPAYVYATLAYGHQVTAFLLLGSYSLIQGAASKNHQLVRFGLAGFLASYAVVVELQVGPVAAILGAYVLTLVVLRKIRANAILAFVLGGLLPALILLGYNLYAFGSPLDMGYFHEDIQQFAEVHSARNPLGVRPPDWSKALPLIWGRYRGLFFYAPIAMLAVPGWIVLLGRRSWMSLIVSLTVCLAVFLVNLSYPEWTGGWSTGPRLLVPMLPFLMLPVAAFLAWGGRGATFLASLLGLAGGLLMLLCQGAGARFPQNLPDPLVQMILPIWRRGGPFARNLVSEGAPRWVGSLDPSGRWMQFAPLVLAQFLAIGGLLLVRSRKAGSPTSQNAPSRG